MYQANRACFTSPKLGYEISLSSKAILRDLQDRNLYSTRRRVEEDIDARSSVRLRFNEEDKRHRRLLEEYDMEDHWEFRSGSTTIGDVFGPNDLLSRSAYREFKSELFWRSRPTFDFGDHSIRDIQCLQAFTAVESSKLSGRFNPDSERQLTQDDLDAWINPLQLFLSESGTIMIGIIWFLNLDCIRNSQPLDTGLFGAELRSRGLCFNICPHYKMHHEKIISAMLRAYHKHPDAHSEHQPVFESCSQCSTIMRFKVDSPKEVMIACSYMDSIAAEKQCLMVAVLRDLGRAKSALDPQ